MLTGLEKIFKQNYCTKMNKIFERYFSWDNGLVPICKNTMATYVTKLKLCRLNTRDAMQVTHFVGVGQPKIYRNELE
jgi:hypothetical protein